MRRRRRTRIGPPILAAAGLVAACLATTRATGEDPPQKLYAKCMALAHAEPSKAYPDAVAWREAGGGDAAEHCVAVALLGLGRASEAARKLEALAEKMAKTKPGLAGQLLGQAASAWLKAEKPEEAYRVQTLAIERRPDDVDALIDRSLTLVSAAKYWEAIDDLNRAIDLDPRRVEALVFRAAAYRRLDTLPLAEDDIARALEVAPYNVDGLLERGNIRRLNGDVAGAQADWMEILRIAPDSPAAEYARLNIQKIAIPADPKRREEEGSPQKSRSP